MIQASLLDWTPPNPERLTFHGATFDAALDLDRLNSQQRRVFDATYNAGWLTLSEIHDITGDPEASISARLRDLRKAGLRVDRQRRGEPKNGLHEYSVRKP